MSALDAMTDAEVVALARSVQPHDEAGAPMVSCHWDLWRRLVVIAAPIPDDDAAIRAMVLAWLNARIADPEDFAQNILNEDELCEHDDMVRGVIHTINTVRRAAQAGEGRAASDLLHVTTRRTERRMSDTEREGLSSPSDLREQIEAALSVLSNRVASSEIQDLVDELAALPALRERVSLPTVPPPLANFRERLKFCLDRSEDDGEAELLEHLLLRYDEAVAQSYGLAQKETEKR